MKEKLAKRKYYILGGIALLLVAVLCLFLFGVIPSPFSPGPEEIPTIAWEDSQCARGNHKTKRIIGEKPTCDKAGRSDKVICEVCGEVLEESVPLPATNHNHREVTEIAPVPENDVAYEAHFHCPDCGLDFIDSLLPADVGMPIINVRGDLTLAHSGTVEMTAEYRSENVTFDGPVTMKIQGQASTQFPIKNYTIKFYDKTDGVLEKHKLELFDGHKEYKYCLKANYIDASQGRNIVAARIYKQVAESRGETADAIAATDTKCVIDGFPVLMYVNGQFHGLYTLNMPKDNWVLDMKRGEDRREAALFSRLLDPTNRLEVPMVVDHGYWEMEFASTEDIPEIGYAWAEKSFNEIVTALNTLSDDELKKVLPTLVNIDRTIDCLIYTTVICAYDNRMKNILYLTYDGVQWAPTMYDMDSTFGLNFDGTAFYYPSFEYQNFLTTGTLLYRKVFSLYHDEFIARYRDLRRTVLSKETFASEFGAFFDSIPAICYETNFKKNAAIPFLDKDSKEQILTFINARLDYLDSVW